MSDAMTTKRVRNESTPENIGDGLFASFDGYQIRLMAQAEGGSPNVISIDDEEWENLLQYRERVKPQTGATP